jgi:hypothetical protein
MPRQKPTDPITNVTESVSLNLNLLTKLVHHLVDVEKRQQRFRTCVLIRLSRIESMVTEVQGCQLAQCWPNHAPMTDELRTKYLQEVQDRIDSASEKLGVKMVRYIHQEPEAPEKSFDRRRKWWGWEI